MKRIVSASIVVLALVMLVVVAGCSSPPAATPSETTPAQTTAPSSTASTESATPPASAGVSVSIANFAFDPADLTVKVGDTVTWTNNDSAPHTVTGADFDSGSMAQGATFSKTFDKAGTFDYTCTFHPQMVGKVTVQ